MCEPCEPGADPANVPRRPLDFAEDADPCPICYEDIGPADDAAGLLDWCRKSCGKSLHKRCFAMWAEHQQSIGQKLTCPHCRGEWSEEQQQVHGRGGCCSSLGGTGTAHTGGGASGGAGGGSSGTVAGAAAAAAARRAVHKDARCKSCRVMGIAGARYRCLVCPQGTVELCGECFDSCMHPHHPFAVRERPRAAWAVARCRANDDGPPPPSERPSHPGSRHESEAQLATALAELQSREITPEDYELLMALSSRAGGELALPSHPNTYT